MEVVVGGIDVAERELLNDKRRVNKYLEAVNQRLPIGGVFEGRLRFDLDKDGEEKRARAEKTAELDLDAVLTMDMLVRSDDAAFIACGVTDGEMVSGVSNADGSVTTECVVMNA